MNVSFMYLGNVLFGGVPEPWWLGGAFFLFVVLAFSVTCALVRSRVCLCCVLLPGLLLLALSLLVGEVFFEGNARLQLLLVVLTTVLFVIPLTHWVLKTTWTRSVLIWAITLMALVVGIRLSSQVQPSRDVNSRGRSGLERAADAVRQALRPQE